MARSEPLQATVGCPSCDAVVTAPVPVDSRAADDWDASRLRGIETNCGNCGHEVDVYYY